MEQEIKLTADELDAVWEAMDILEAGSQARANHEPFRTAKAKLEIARQTFETKEKVTA